MKSLKRILVLCLVVAMVASVAIIPASAVGEADATAFVTQLYQGLLGRTPDDNGRIMYVNMLMNGNTDAARLAETIIQSNEFRARSLDNEQYINALYEGLLGRSLDESGRTTYVTNGLNNGSMTRSGALKSILSSLEFVKVAANLNMYVGTISESANVNVAQTVVNSSLATQYVTRLYQNLLGRAPDANGLNNWTTRLTNKTNTAAEVAAYIASSNEFNQRSLSDGEYVQALYKALLGRAVDGYGWSTYMTALATGKSRSWVFSSICGSSEFQNQFGEMGASAGSVSSSKYAISGNTVNETAAGEFVDRCYLNLLGHYPDSDGRANYISILVERKMSAAGVAADIAGSAEARNRDLTRADFVTNVYWALLNRAPDAAGLKTYVQALINGYSRSWVFTKICASSEFQSRDEFNTMNVVPGYLNSANYNMG